jgi:hypothetical protein
MPLHDWGRVDVTVFRAFHLGWISEMSHALNGGMLLPDYYALIARVTGAAVPDLPTLRCLGRNGTPSTAITIHHVSNHQVVARVEIMSPGSTNDQPLTCVSSVGGRAAAVFVELLAVGEPLPDMPLFLTPDVYMPVPLEATYQAAWEGMPAYWRDVLTSAPQPPAGP